MRYPERVSPETLWIFGYGSLVWRPAFRHMRAQPACIEGFARRFWQGSTDHRGLPERPGRVVTLVDARESRPAAPLDSRDTTTSEPAEPCWGTAYEVPIDDPHGVLAQLDHRERGGYERIEIDILIGPGVPVEHASPDRIQDRPREVQRAAGLVYIAGPTNENYLGPASVEEIAEQVARAHGPSGPNPEYVFELARSLRKMGAADPHVFAVEAALASILAREIPRETR